jgi:hypothetical protein
MTNHPWEVFAYPDSRLVPEKPPDMIYLPSVELIQKMIMASAKNKQGKIVGNEYDILERFISTEKEGKKIKIKRASRGRGHKKQEKQLENYANENQTFFEISEFDKFFDLNSNDIDLSKLASFIPSHKTNKR